MGAPHRHRSPSAWSPQQVPRGPVEVDRTHPLARGLAAFYLPGRGGADLGGICPPLVSAASGQPGPGAGAVGAGFGASTTSAASGLVSGGTLPALDFSGGATIWLWRHLLGAPLGGGLPWIIAISGANDTRRFTLYSDTGGSNRNCFLNGGYAGSAGGGYGPGVHTTGATWSPATGAIVYTSGISNGGAGSASTIGFNPATDGFSVATGGNAVVFACAFWNRALSVDEMAGLDAAPLAMLRHAGRRLLRPPRFASVAAPIKRPTLFVVH